MTATQRAGATRWLCVFCGSSPGRVPAHRRLAASLGEAVAERGWGLVYGGAQVGLMGVVADAALAAGAPVVGVLPRSLSSVEIAHPALSELVLVDGMAERKAEMAQRSDAFVALPGGMGTLDELFEMLTWTQLALHPRPKPSAVLDVDGYWAPMLTFLDRAVDDGYLSPAHRAELVVASAPGALLDDLASRLGDHGSEPAGARGGAAP